MKDATIGDAETANVGRHREARPVPARRATPRDAAWGGTSLWLPRAALFALLLVIPTYNPALIEIGAERVYLAFVLVLVAAAFMLLHAVRRRIRWILAGVSLAGIYVLVVGPLQGKLEPAVLANAYRPIQPMLVFCAFATFVGRVERERWLRLFLLGGVVGCMLGVLNTLVPAIDPFALSRPELPWQSTYGTLDRQAGAFVYPNNFGTYAAYVAVVALVTVERRSDSLRIVNLPSLAFLAGVLGIVVSGSRSAALGLAVAVAVVLWRTRRLRRAVLIAVIVGTGILTGIGYLAGVLTEVYENRILDAVSSISLRQSHWEAAWRAFEEDPLLGAGVVPGTVDSTYFYLLQVGGIVGLVVVAAMCWITFLRPVHRGPGPALPLALGAAVTAAFQDTLGQPLANWALGASFFLLWYAKDEPAGTETSVPLRR